MGSPKGNSQIIEQKKCVQSSKPEALCQCQLFKLTTTQNRNKAKSKCETFHKNGFALRLALKQRHKGTGKWPIRDKFELKIDRLVLSTELTM